MKALNMHWMHDQFVAVRRSRPNLVRDVCAQILLVIVTAACADDPVRTEPDPEYIPLQPDSVDLLVGDTLRIAAPTTSTHGTPIELPGAWSSLDPSVVEVDSTGLVVATDGGDALVAFEASGMVGYVDVSVARRDLAWADIAAGCGIRTSAVLCWDWSGGELSAPQPTGTSVAFGQVARGPTHACAIGADRHIYCWGSNTYGQLGDGTTTGRDAPTRIVNDEFFLQVSVGPRHTCAVNSTAVVFCWGSDAHGQLGIGGSTELCNGVPCRTRPTFVQLPAYAVAIDAGGTADAGATCAITNDGKPYCWGTNADGILGDGGAVPGDGEATPHSLPQPVSSSQRFATIAVGGSHACAVTNGRHLYCWGANASGQRGTDDGASATSTPVEVTTLDGPALAVVAADTHTCARLWHGGVQCWGSNDARQVSPASGGPATVVTTPVDVAGSRTFVSIAASDDRTCGITTDDEVVCWGGGLSPTTLPDTEQG